MTADQHEHPLHNLAMDIRYDLTAAQGKLTELMRQIGELDLPTPTERQSFMNGPVTAHTCGSCGVGNGQHAYDCPDLGDRPSIEQLAEHGLLHSGIARAHVPSREPS